MERYLKDFSAFSSGFESEKLVIMKIPCQLFVSFYSNIILSDRIYEDLICVARYNQRWRVMRYCLLFELRKNKSERHKSAPYLRLKNSKRLQSVNCSLLQTRKTQMVDRIGAPFRIFNIHSVANIKKKWRRPFEVIENFSRKKSRNVE